MSLQQLQIDIAAQIASTPLAANVPVFVFRPRAANTAVAIQSRIDQALGPLVGRAGLCGLAAIVQMPVVDTPEQEMPGPYLHAKTTVLVQESPIVNMGANGTQIACEDFAINVAQALHLWTPGNVAGILRASRHTMTPDLTFGDRITYRVDVETELSIPLLNPTMAVVFSVSNGVVTLTSNTPGAQIWFTDDGTTPAPGSGEIVTTATQYTEPFTVSLSTFSHPLLRAAAFGDGLRGSDITTYQF